MDAEAHAAEETEKTWFQSHGEAIQTAGVIATTLATAYLVLRAVGVL